MKKSINTNGVSTRSLLEIIPKKDVQTALDAYDEINKLQKLSEIPSYPHDELKTIKRALSRILESGWISKKEHDDLLDDIRLRIGGGKGGLSTSNEYVKSMLRKGPRGRTKKFALDVLSFSLIFMLRQKESPHFELVGGFLQENKISSAEITYLKKKRSKQSLIDICDILCTLGAIQNKSNSSSKSLSRFYTIIFFNLGKFNKLLSCLQKYELTSKERSALLSMTEDEINKMICHEFKKYDRQSPVRQLIEAYKLLDKDPTKKRGIPRTT